MSIKAASKAPKVKAFFDHGKGKDNWIEAFSLCQKYMENMNPQDFKLFVKDCILSERILGHIPKPARGRIFKKSVKFVEIQIAAKAEGLEGIGTVAGTC